MIRRLAALAVAAALLAGCGGYDDTVVVPDETAAPGAAAPVTTTPCDNDGSEVRSYAPDSGTQDGAAVQTIRDRGRLIAGVAADTKLLGARKPGGTELEGFDIDMALAIAQQIWPDDDPRDRVDFRVITAAQRIPFLQDGTIDIVARNMTVNCTRWQQIAFSEIYFDASQKVLVGTTSGIETIEDLAGKRICAPAGTTSIDNIQAIQPDAIPVTSTDNSACMILFQNGEADGVSTDDTVLAGLQAQDPYSTVIPDGPGLTYEPYGIGVNSSSVDLVRLINQTLEDMRDDGRWQASYDQWLEEPLGEGTQPRAKYGR